MTEVYDGTGEYHRLWEQQMVQTQNASYTHGTAGGTADAITLTLSPPITAYAAGQSFSFVAGGTNTGAVTLNVDGLGAKAVTKNGTTALTGGEIISGATVDVKYDGTRFQITNPAITNYVTTDTTQTITGDKTLSGSTTLSGNVTISGVIQGGSPLVFEGATADDFETTFAITDPTADRTITFKDASGTVAFTSDTASAATQAEQEAATSTTAFVSPGRQQYHPSAPKAWVRFDGTGTLAINSSYNVSSVTDGGVGIYTVNFTTAFADDQYAMFVYLDSGIGSAGGSTFSAQIQSVNTTDCQIRTYNINTTTPVLTDIGLVTAVFYGDQ